MKKEWVFFCVFFIAGLYAVCSPAPFSACIFSAILYCSVYLLCGICLHRAAPGSAAWQITTGNKHPIKFFVHFAIAANKTDMYNRKK